MHSYSFIYIAALPRTGSTLLSELLTDLPHSFIFHEPHLGKNYFALQPIDQNYLEKYEIDVADFLKFRLPAAFIYRRLRSWGYRQDYMMKAFKNQLLPQLQATIQQIGVKEIKHTGWQNYVQHFPNMKVIMLGRDPHDLYLSMYRKWQRGSMVWQGDFTPKTVAAQLEHEFQMQLSLKKETDTLCVRYEDLCNDTSIVKQIKTFVNSPIPELGKIGAFISSHPKRAIEHDVHKGSITNKRIGGWQYEKDVKLLADIQEFSSLMTQYREFWGYDGE